MKEGKDIGKRGKKALQRTKNREKKEKEKNKT